MLKLACLSALLCVAGVAAHAQCNGLSAYTIPGATFNVGIQPNAADLNCMQSHLEDRFLSRSGGTITGELTTTPLGNPVATGDNVATLDFKGGRVNILRQLLKTVTNTPNIVIQLSNASHIPLAPYGLYPQLSAMQVQAQGLDGGTASLTGGLFLLDLFGDSPYQAEDVAVQSTINQYGSDSAWLFDGFARDLTGMPPKAFSQVGAEYDMSANGPDFPGASYDPLHTYRQFIDLNPGLVKWPGWAANTAYRAGIGNSSHSVIQQKSAAGVLSIYVATTGGTSGERLPVFPDSGKVSDGSVVWTYEQPAAVEYGRGVWLDSGYGGDERGTTISFGTGFATNARFQNAVIDFSEATLAPGTTAAIRIAANQPIDLSGNGTAAGQNQHVLQYSNAADALTYTIKGGLALSIADTGLASFPGQIQAPLATPKSSSSPCVTGTRTADTDYEYVCVATNTWKRAALSPF